MDQGYQIYSGVGGNGSAATGQIGATMGGRPAPDLSGGGGMAAPASPFNLPGAISAQTPSISTLPGGGVSYQSPPANQGMYSNYVSGGNWFDAVNGHGINPDYFTNGSLNSKALQDKSLLGLGPDLINQINASQGGYQLGQTYSKDGDPTKYSYGMLPGSSYLGEYAKVNGQAYNPDHYQTAIDEWNTHVQKYNAGSPFTVQGDLIGGVGQLNEAKNLGDIFSQVGHDSWLGQQKIDPYFSNIYSNAGYGAPKGTSQNGVMTSKGML